MKPLTVGGAVLLAFGLIALLFQGIRYTSRETVIDLGPIQATAERQRTLPIPPLVGIAAVLGGVAMLVAGTRRA
jgi:hypothetical protein